MARLGTGVPGAAPSGRRRLAARSSFHLVVLIAVVTVVYAHGLSGGFVWDDEVLILEKKDFFSDPANVIAIVASSDTALHARPTPYYRPLTTLTFLADRHLWGDDAFGYRLENLILHGGAVLLLYLVTLSAFGDAILAFFCALLFAVHPANAEAVSFVSARNNLLCAVFLAASLLLLQKKTAGGTLAALAVYGLALLSKEPAVVLPFFLLSLGAATGEERLRTSKGVLASFFGVTAIYLLVRLLVLGTVTSAGGLEISAQRLGLVASSLYENVRILLVPWKLNALYTPEFTAFRPYKAIVAAAGVGALLYCGLGRRVPEPLRVGALWVLLSLLVVSNVVRIPSAPVAERYLYVPAMGFAAIAGYGMRALHRKRAAWGVAAVTAACLLLGARAFERTGVWRDDLALSISMVAADPKNAEARYNLGFAHFDAGRSDLAFRDWTEAVRLDPSHARAYNSLGNLYGLSGDYRAAMASYAKALSLAPGEFVVHFNLARAADLLGEREVAVRHYRAFLDRGERSPAAAHRAMASKARERLAAITAGAGPP